VFFCLIEVTKGLLNESFVFMVVVTGLLCLRFTQGYLFSAYDNLPHELMTPVLLLSALI
jgi:hypothetical protein